MTVSASGPGTMRWQDSLGNPTPFCFLTFSITAMFNGMSGAGWIDPVHSLGVTLPLTLFLGGFGMIGGAVLEWIKGSTFHFTMFAVYGFYWLTYAMSIIFPTKAIVPSGAVDPSSYAGFFWMMMLITAFFMTHTLTKGRRGVMTILYGIVLLVFLLLGTAFTGLAKGNPESYATTMKIQSYVVMIFGLIGYYLAAAVMNGWYPMIPKVSDLPTWEAKSGLVNGASKTSSSVSRLNFSANEQAPPGAIVNNYHV